MRGRGGAPVNTALLAKEDIAASVARVKGWLARFKAAPKGSEEQKALLAERPHLLDCLTAKAFPASVTQRELTTAIHEAGHAVILIRFCGKVKYVELTEVGVGCCHHSHDHLDLPYGYKRHVLFVVAGHFAAWKWGFESRLGDFGCGASSDFIGLARLERASRAARNNETTLRRVSKQDVVATRKVWRNAMRRLDRLAKKDPTIEAQVMAVAAALVVKKWLEGDDVETLMRGVRP
jgi:hypothetical protein